MKYQIVGDSDCPLAEISLDAGQTASVERGAMVYMRNVDLSASTNSKSSGLGGLVRAVARSAVSNESVFITTATGTANGATIGIAPSTPGKISVLHCGAAQYRLNDHAYLASDASVTYNMVRQKAGGAIFGGTGGFFVMETQGEGDVLVSAFGDLIELDVTPEAPITIDNEHVVAWDASLNYRIEVASGTFGFMTGEGLVNKFSGTGKVLIQSRNAPNLANILAPYLPSNG